MVLGSPTESEIFLVDFTKSMPQLEKLSIKGGVASGNFLCSLSQFSQQLQKLSLRELGLTTLSFIPQLTCLIFLDLTNNKITSLEYLRTDGGQKKFPLLQVLRLQGNCLTHKEEDRLDLLLELPLKAIDLRENFLEEVPKLGNILHHLERLDLRMNNIPDTIISKYEERKNMHYKPQRKKSEVKDNL
jgi:hypothetical protein